MRMCMHAYGMSSKGLAHAPRPALVHIDIEKLVTGRLLAAAVRSCRTAVASKGRHVHSVSVCHTNHVECSVWQLFSMATGKTMAS